MFPILFIILFLFCQSESAFYDSDKVKLDDARSILSEKLILSLKIKGDFLTLAHDLDSLRKSNILKSKIEPIAQEFNKINSTDITGILNLIDKISNTVQEIQPEVQRIRSRFMSLQQSALMLASIPEATTENSKTIDNGLSSLLTNAQTPALASIESFLQFKKLAEQAKLMSDSLIMYKRFADTIRIHGENAFSKLSKAGQDSLRKYLSLLESNALYIGINDSLTKYSNFQDTLIDRLGFPAVLTKRKELADSVNKYIGFRDSLRAKMTQISATTNNDERRRLEEEASELRATKEKYEYLRDTIAHYAANPSRIAGVIPANPAISSAISFATGQKSLADAGKEMALTLGRSLFPQGSKLMDSAQKYFRFYSYIIKEIDYKKSLAEAQTEEQKEILRHKLLAVSGYSDSLNKYKHYRDSLLFRIPIPTWVGEGQTWLDSLKRFTIIKDSLVLMAKELAASPNRASILTPKIGFYKDSIGKYMDIADSISTYFSSPEKIIPYTPLSTHFEKATEYVNTINNLSRFKSLIEIHTKKQTDPWKIIDTFKISEPEKTELRKYLASIDSLRKFEVMKDKLFSEGALVLMAFVSNSSALPFVSNLLGTASTIKNEAEALLNGKKSMADIAITAGTAIGNTLFPDEMELFQSAQTYLKLAADVNELPSLQASMKAYAPYTNMLSMDNVAIANTLTEAGRDSLASYRTLLTRQTELLQSQINIESYRHYLDSLADRLPIPEWLGKGLPWESAIKRYGELRDSIKLIERNIKDQGNSNVTALQNKLNEVKGRFEPYKHFRDTIKKYIESPELLLAHTPMAEMFNDGKNAILKEQLGNQGTLALMAFAGNATSLPFVERIMGPMSTLLAFQDSLTRYLEIVKDLRSKVDTFEVLLKDPFKIMERFPNIETLCQKLSIPISSITFPPVNSLLSELRNFIRPYLSEVDKLIKYGEDTKTLADEIPGREAFFKGFVTSITEAPEELKPLRLKANNVTTITQFSSKCETETYSGFDFFYSDNSCRMFKSDTAKTETLTEARSILTYAVDFSENHHASIAHLSASSTIGGEITTEVEEIYASQAEHIWEKDGIALFSVSHFKNILDHINKDGVVNITSDDKSLKYELFGTGWEIFFRKKLDNPWPIKVLTKTVAADLTMETISGLPVVTGIKFAPAYGGSDFIEWKLNKNGVTLGK